MDHILRAARAGLPYVYLGYWVEGSKRMQYKIRYRPLERLSKNGWVRFDPDEQQKAIREVAAPRELTANLPVELVSLFRKSRSDTLLRKQRHERPETGWRQIDRKSTRLNSSTNIASRMTHFDGKK